VGWGTEYDVQERTIDAQTDTLTIAGQPVYRPYEMVVLAANEMGEAASRPRPVIGYSSEAGTTSRSYAKLKKNMFHKGYSNTYRIQVGLQISEKFHDGYRPYHKPHLVALTDLPVEPKNCVAIIC